MKLIANELYNDDGAKVLVQIGSVLFALKVEREVDSVSLNKYLDDPNYDIKLLED